MPLIARHSTGMAARTLRIGLAAAAAALLTLSPSNAAATSRCGSHHAAQLRRAGHWTVTLHVRQNSAKHRNRYIVSACDHRNGHTRVLAESETHRSRRTGQPVGYVISGLAAGGDRVAWLRNTIDDYHAVWRIVIARLSTGTIRPTVKEQVGAMWSVLVTRRGDVIWIKNRIVVMTPNGRVRSIRSQAEDLPANGGIFELVDQDRALIYTTVGGRILTLGLVPDRIRGACRVPYGRNIDVDNDQIVVFSSWASMVGCAKKTGRRTILGKDSGEYGSNHEDFRLQGVYGPWVAVIQSGIRPERIAVVNVNTGVEARRVAEHLPDTPADDLERQEIRIETLQGAPLLVSPSGVPVWLVHWYGDDRIATITANGTLHALATGPPGSITNVQIEGASVTWTQAGAKNSAAL